MKFRYRATLAAQLSIPALLAASPAWAGSAQSAAMLWTASPQLFRPALHWFPVSL